MQQRRNGVKGIEEEMRLQLHLQSLQLGLNKLSFQLDRSLLAVAKLPMILKPLIGTQDGPINEHPPVVAHRYVAPHHGPPLEMFVTWSDDKHKQSRHRQSKADPCDHEAGRNMDCQAGRQSPFL